MSRISLLLTVCSITASFRNRQRRKLQNRASPYTWHGGVVADSVWSAEVRDKRAWAEMTLPGARLGRKRQPNAESRREIRRLKEIFPVKLLRRNVEKYDLLDYRVKAEKLPHKGDYYGMGNFHRLLSLANYYRRHWKYSYPEKHTSLSLYELVDGLDISLDDDDVFDSPIPLSSRSEPEIRSLRKANLIDFKNKSMDDIDTPVSSRVSKHSTTQSLVSLRSKCQCDRLEIYTRCVKSIVLKA